MITPLKLVSARGEGVWTISAVFGLIISLIIEMDRVLTACCLILLQLSTRFIRKSFSCDVEPWFSKKVVPRTKPLYMDSTSWDEFMRS